MPKGPKGEYRPADPIKSAMLVMRIAVGDLTEEEAKKLTPKRRKPVKARKKRST